MVPFTPRLIPAILPNLAHHVAMIQSAAQRTNKVLSTVIQALPSPPDLPPRLPEKVSNTHLARSTTPTTSPSATRQSTTTTKDSRELSSPELVAELPPKSPHMRPRGSGQDISMIPRPSLALTEMPVSPPPPSRPASSLSFTSASHASQPQTLNMPTTSSPTEEDDLFNYQATVNELTIQFLSEFEETRVAALKWLIMLHQKAPKKVSSVYPVNCQLISVRFWQSTTEPSQPCSKLYLIAQKRLVSRYSRPGSYSCDRRLSNKTYSCWLKYHRVQKKHISSLS